MKNKKIYKIKNGPKVVLYQDMSKHCTLTSLFVRFGGKHQNIKLNNQDYKIPNGMAHFIEHLLIEHSIYGNTLLEFEKKHTISNGYTTKDTTEYVINSVVDFNSDLIKLINIVNNASFDEESIEETKKAIVKEKMMSDDDNFEALAKVDYEAVFKNIEYPNLLGEISDIKDMSYQDVKKCYDIFYQPNNQILVISGNFKMGEIEKLIKDTYRNIKKQTIDYTIPKIIEKDDIVSKEKVIYKDVHTDYVRLNYKVNVKNITNKDKLKLDFYMDYYLSYLFDSTSKVYTSLVNDKICVYDISYFYLKVEDFFVIKIGTTTDNHDEFIKRVKKAMDNKEVNEEDFILRKKKNILNILLREDTLSNTISPFIDNIISYDYDEMDKVEDIEMQSFEDYKEWINKLDFSSYAITKMLKIKEN